MKKKKPIKCESDRLLQSRDELAPKSMNYVENIASTREHDLTGVDRPYKFNFLIGLNMHFIPVIRGRLKFHP